MRSTSVQPSGEAETDRKPCAQPWSNSNRKSHGRLRLSLPHRGTAFEQLVGESSWGQAIEGAGAVQDSKVRKTVVSRRLRWSGPHWQPAVGHVSLRSTRGPRAASGLSRLGLATRIGDLDWRLGLATRIRGLRRNNTAETKLV